MLRGISCGASLLIALNTVAGEATPDQILRLRGIALFETADRADTSSFIYRDLIRITDLLAIERKNIPAGHSSEYALSNFFETACRQADGRELDHLIQLYVSFPAESFEKAIDFQPLAARWIKRELGAVKKQVVALPDIEIALPPKLENSPPELVKAWRTFKKMTAPVEQTVYSPSAKPSISFQANERAFFRALDDVLMKHGERLAERLAKFGWSGYSATSSDAVYEPQSIAIFMALMSERRLSEAIGSALLVETERPLATGDMDVCIEFLRKCEVDWESALVGAEVEAELRGMWLWRHPFLEELAAYGSDRAAVLVGMLARSASADRREDYAHAISGFLLNASQSLPRFNNGAFDRVSKTPISHDVQMSLVAILQDFAKPDAPSGVALAALDGLAHAKSPGTKPTLYALTKHSSRHVAAEAAQVLQSMGENVTVPLEDLALRFRIFANGKLLAPDSRIHWQIGSIESSDEVSDNGTVTISRDDFFGDERKPDRVTLSSRSSETLEQPDFRVELPLPLDSNSITRVDVEVCPFQFIIRSVPQNTDCKPKSATAQVKRHPGEDAKSDAETLVYEDYSQRHLDLPTDQTVTLLMQRGRYDLVITSPGAARFKNEIAVSPYMSPVEIQLQKGSDICWTLIRPDGERRAPFQLLKDGINVSEEYFDFRTRKFRGLPLGSYTLRIIASDIVRADDDDFKDFAPANIPYAGRDIRFVITPDSPELVDLGTIRLEPAKR